MKKNLLTIAALALVAGALTITGCKKEDTTSPEVTAPADKTISLNSSYTQENGTATDDKDGELTVTYSGAVDANLTGTYTVTFTATDAAGNVGTAEQTVTVVNDAAAWGGSYTVKDTCGSGVAATPFAYNQTVTASSTVNNRVNFNKFADYANNSNIYATIAGNTITVSSQIANNIGSASENHTFSSTYGVKTSTGFRLDYNDQNNSAVGNPTASCRAYFTK